MAESLRETVEQAFDSVIETPAVDTTTQAVSAPAQDTSTAAERARDEKGRFAPTESAAPVKNKQEQPPTSSGAAPALTMPAAADPAKPRYQRPSTWRKETWGVWDKLNTNQPLSPEEQDLFVQEAIKRDSDFANGISTYKREWETAKPLIDAMAPFLPLLQQHNIQPGQWIQNLGNAHRMLAMGSPQEKAGRFVQLAREYGVPLEQLFMVGQDGRLQINQQFQAQAQQAPQPQGVRPEDVQALIDQRLTQRWADEQLSQFAAQKEKYPHYDEVKQTMLGLLQAGLADDLSGAYEAALRHPRHAAVYEAQQQQLRQQDEQAKAEAARKQAELARKKATSVRSSTPTSAGGADGKKGLRSTIENAFDEHVGGRV